MKKKLYILPLLAAAALNFSSCSNEDESIFDQSAAERLEAGRKSFSDALCAEGGIWVMEYFSNVEEPGYIFVCEFEPDGSVTISTDHDWIGGQFKSEKSLWAVISDNGNVLTFNSYNTLFHVFSTPENIVGPGAPTNDRNEDINEQGYGHNGDYEFMLMENDGQTIRMLGKKRSLNIYLHRLPQDTDVEAYLAGIKAARTQFLTKFPTLTLTDLTSGDTYDMLGLSSGVVSVVPYKSTNPNAQTITGNGIFTADGFRFMKTTDIIRRDDSFWPVDGFVWAEDGSLVSTDKNAPARIAAQNPGINLQNVRFSWILDKDSMSPVLAAAHDAASANLQEVVGSRYDLRNVTYGYFANAGVTYFSLTTNVGTRICRDYCELKVNDDATEATISVVASNKASADLTETAPDYVAFKQMLMGDFTVSNIAPMNPGTIVFTSKSNPDVSFSVNVQ